MPENNTSALTVLKRRVFLEILSDDPMDRRDLEERLDVSRTTVYRATTELLDLGFLEHVDGTYRSTHRGKAVLEVTKQYHDSLRAIDSIAPLVELVDAPVFLRHIDLFVDSTMIVADRTNPYRAIHYVQSCIENVDRWRGVVTRRTIPDSVPRTLAQVQNGATVELVLEEEALEFAAADVQGGLIAAEQMGDLKIYRTTETDLSIHLFDDRVVIPGFSRDEGTLTVVVETDSEDAIAWARSLIDRQRNRAERVI